LQLETIFSLFGISTYESALIGWTLGALYMLLLPFYFKVRRGELTWKDFNLGYLINFATSIMSGLAASLFLFILWDIPNESNLAVLIIAFFVAIGYDKEAIERILEKFKVYEKVFEILNPKNYPHR
jgi:ABC-type multidrug transport system permease subunit